MQTLERGEKRGKGREVKKDGEMRQKKQREKERKRGGDGVLKVVYKKVNYVNLVKSRNKTNTK